MFSSTPDNKKNDWLFQLIINKNDKINDGIANAISPAQVVFFLTRFNPNIDYIKPVYKLGTYVQDYDNPAENPKKLLFDAISSFNTRETDKQYLKSLNNSIVNKIRLNNAPDDAQLSATNTLLNQAMDANKLKKIISTYPTLEMTQTGVAELKAKAALATAKAKKAAASSTSSPDLDPIYLAAATAAEEYIAAAKNAIDETAKTEDAAKAAITADIDTTAAADIAADQKHAAGLLETEATTFKRNLPPYVIDAANKAAADKAAADKAAAEKAKVDKAAADKAAADKAAALAAKNPKALHDIAAENLAKANIIKSKIEKILTQKLAAEFKAAADAAFENANNAKTFYTKSHPKVLGDNINATIAQAKILQVEAQQAINDADSAATTAAPALAKAEGIISEPSWSTDINDSSKIKKVLTDLKKLYYDEKKNIAKGFEPSIINKGYLKTDYAAAAAAAATAVSPPDIFFENDEIYSYTGTWGTTEYKIPPANIASIRPSWRQKRKEKWTIIDNKLKYIYNSDPVLQEINNLLDGSKRLGAGPHEPFESFSDKSKIQDLRDTYLVEIKKVDKEATGISTSTLTLHGGGKQYNKKTLKYKQLKRKQTHRNQMHRTQNHRKQNHRKQTHKK